MLIRGKVESFAIARCTAGLKNRFLPAVGECGADLGDCTAIARSHVGKRWTGAVHEAEKVDGHCSLKSCGLGRREFGEDSRHRVVDPHHSRAELFFDRLCCPRVASSRRISRPSPRSPAGYHGDPIGVHHFGVPALGMTRSGPSGR
jgi:hypothetical protein